MPLGVHSRHALSLAASLLLHAAIALALVARGVVPLVLTPAPVLVDLVEPGRHDAGPGSSAPQLELGAAARGSVSPPVQSAPPPEPPAMSAPAADPPALSAPPPPALAADPIPDPLPKKVDAKKTAKPPSPPAAAKKPAARADARAKPPAAGTVATAPANGTAPPSGDERHASTRGGGRGAPAAPAWAPSARVRYEALLFAWMERHKAYPLVAQRRGLEGSGALRVRIDRSGRVVERELVRSTGTPALDDAALDMVRRASPFPAVPAEYSGATFEFVAPVEYRLR